MNMILNLNRLRHAGSQGRKFIALLSLLVWIGVVVAEGPAGKSEPQQKGTAQVKIEDEKKKVLPAEKSNTEKKSEPATSESRNENDTMKMGASGESKVQRQLMGNVSGLNSGLANLRFGNPDDYVSVSRIIEDLLRRKDLDVGQNGKSERWRSLEGLIDQVKDLLNELKQYDLQAEVQEPDGAWARLQAKARRYEVERQARERLSRLTTLLVETLEREIAREKERLSFEDRVRKLAKLAAQEQERRLNEVRRRITPSQTRLTANEKGTDSRPDVAKAPEHFEYYELKKRATLKEVSALPEVYGDKNQWDVLWNANRDVVSDPLQPLPRGTVLIVPRLEKKLDLNF
ncbi:MAG: hypothetical protein D6820_01480 [Lentisphaerae bacterium]|nr:MAG: hypothetical protein D6820_01480 [Lentisphaerota bacterium]